MAYRFRHSIIEEVPATPINNYVFIRDIYSIDNQDFIVTETKVDERLYYDKSIRNTIRIGKDDFNYFYNRIDDCVKFWCETYKKCDGEEVLIAKSYFTLNNLVWDLDRCVADIDLKYGSIYPCIEDNKDKVWLFGLTTPYSSGTIGQLTGFGRILKFSPANTESFISDDLFDLVRGVSVGIGENCPGFHNGKPSGISYIISDFFNWVLSPYYFLGIQETVSILSAQFSSDPLINSLSPVPNYVNPGQDPYFIAVSSKSNMVTPNASNPQTYFEITFEQIEKMLIEVFNVYWVVENQYYLRFEHYSWFVRNVEYDSTTLTNFPYNANKRKFKIDSDKLPSKETWTFSNGNMDDFVGVPIIYGQCSSRKEKNRGDTFISTDPGYLNSNTSITDLDGIVLWDLILDYTINNQFNPVIAAGELSGINRYNGRLSIANLHEDLHKHNRPFIEGNMNNTPTTFLSPVYKKEQDNIVVKNCCADEVDKTFALVRTELGDGIITEAEVNYSKDIITFKTRHT